MLSPLLSRPWSSSRATPSPSRNLAFSLQALDRDEQALLHYRTALALGDQQASTPANMAIAYYETGQMAQAADAARQALAADGKLAPAYAVLGAVALDKRQPGAALLPLYRALLLDPGYSPAYFFLGMAYKTLDRPVEAMAAYGAGPDRRSRRGDAAPNPPSPGRADRRAVTMRVSYPSRSSDFGRCGKEVIRPQTDRQSIP